jgi:hypothetical protein
VALSLLIPVSRAAAARVTRSAVVILMFGFFGERLRSRAELVEEDPTRQEEDTTCASTRRLERATNTATLMRGGIETVYWARN